MCIYQLGFHAVGRPLSLTPILTKLTLSIYTLIRPQPYQYNMHIALVQFQHTAHHTTPNNVLFTTITQCP